MRPSGAHPDNAGALPDKELDGTPFARLDRDLPLLLLPVRIETRFELTADPPALRIRIYPDQVHVDAGFGEPSAVERDFARQFWTAWHAARREDDRAAAWRTLLRRVGAKRAGHVARAYEPTLGPGGVLTFPPPKEPVTGAAARPVLLPRQWLAIGYVGGAQIFRKASERVASGLRTGPDAAARTSKIADGALTVDEGLAWMIDYVKAETAGMAITVPLVGAAAAAREQVDVLLVVGVDHEVDGARSALELSRLLDVHSRTSGLAFVSQGTPTNNTESAASGWTPQEAEADVGSTRALGSGKRARSEPADNASRLASALGFANDETLRRLAHGADREGLQSEDMRVVLFEAVLGTFLRELLDLGSENAVSQAAVTEVRRWFIDHVTGGAPVPTIRVGPQPYGILPVRRSVAQPDLSTTRGQVERIVAALIDVWRRSAAHVPVLDSDRADVGGAGEAESVIASIFATQPHPARLFARTFEEYVAGETPFSLQPIYALLLEAMMAGAPDSPDSDGIREVGLRYLVLGNDEYPNGFASVDDQLDLWHLVEDQLREQVTGEVLQQGLRFIGNVFNVLGPYEERQRPLRWIGLDRFAGVLGEENTRLVAGRLEPGAYEWGDTGLIEGGEGRHAKTAAEYLGDLRTRLAASGGGLNVPIPPSPQPLLYQLIDKALQLVPARPADRERVIDALDRLARLDAQALEWLLRETLGLGAHRLDGWATSLASERLTRIRAGRPTGLHVGAFGWVVDLKPRAQRRPSEGFIHAPSMAQATTAALLRAGWHAHGTDDPSSPVAVNLSSDRVRTADWLLEGVRQGQPLGDLLGYRFERLLHDLGASNEIRRIRERTLEAEGRPAASPDRPVDGIALLELHRAQKLGTSSAAVVRALGDLEAAFDAVNDVALFESVHQIAGGNNDRATAMLDAMSLGTVAPPQVRSTRTPRSAVSVEHRVIVLLQPVDAEAAAVTLPKDGPWSKGIRDRIAPELEAWVASLLPRADQVGFSVEPAGGGAGPSTALTLKSLRLSALDAIYLLGDDPREVPAALRTLAAGPAGSAGPVRIDPSSAGGAAVSLADFAVLAGELRRLLETLRSADARDLRPASAAGEPGVDTAQALAAVNAVLSDITTLRDHLDRAIDGGRTNQVAAAVEGFARLGISTGEEPANVAAAATLRELVARRMANVRSKKFDVRDAAAAEAGLAALLARRLPVLGRFTLTGAEGGAVVDTRMTPPGAEEVDDWIDAVSRVRPDVGKLSTVGTLSELMGARGLTLRVGQQPLGAGESWCANHRPNGPGRVSVVAVCGPDGPPAAGQAACGLVVDRWSEPVPGDEQVTGVTFQFDAPGNRPPQAWLLAVTPDGEPWSLKLVADTLLETLEWASLRAVGPEDLVDYGRAIPTSFLPGALQSWPRES